MSVGHVARISDLDTVSVTDVGCIMVLERFLIATLLSDPHTMRIEIVFNDTSTLSHPK